jgi:glycosyltransferase involved in cell wall biosynthesis
MNSPKTLPAPLSVLMPVCNEADVIEGVVEEWVADVFKYLPEGSEFLIDDAESSDGTREILDRLALKYPYLKVEHRPTKDGFPAAARRLYLRAKCPYIFFTDSDGQYIAADFWKLAKHVPAYDVVHGAKLGRKDPLPRRVFSSLFNKLSSFLVGTYYIDINSAFRLMKREVIEEVLPKVNVMPALINAEFLLRCELDNLAIKQVYILHRPRRFGTSRGLPVHRFFIEGFRAFRGLLKIKESYRSDVQP